MTLRTMLFGAAMLAVSACSDAPGEGEANEASTPVRTEARAVRVGPDPNADACAGFGEVRSGDASGQPVLAAPARDAAETLVHHCIDVRSQPRF